MVAKVNDFLAGLPMTIVGAVFLVLSLAATFTGTELVVDPAWATVIICGLPLVYLSVWRIVHNPGISKISSALLISLAMVAAILIGDLFAAGEVVFIMALGAILEEMTTDRAKKGLRKLMDLVPTTARIVCDGEERVVPAEQVTCGDLLRVLPGETIPVDGTVVAGATSVDQSVMTGESLPVDKEVGDEVFCGTMNRFGSIDVEATKVGQDSSLQKLIRMVEEAENRQAPMQRIADKVASWLVPIALGIAIVAGAVQQDIVVTVTVMVVFCPCALVLATPTAIMAAIGQATKHGVVIKSGEALEKMGKVDTVAFDKTGTLTYGTLSVGAVVAFEDVSEEGVLMLAASAESRSEHPLGKAIVADAVERGIELASPEDFSMTAGGGICASVLRRKVVCGNEKFLHEMGVETDGSVEERIEPLRSEGNAVVLVSDGSRVLGAIALGDTMRPESAQMVSQLGETETDVVLLTGDHRNTAEHFAAQAGINQVKAQLMPGEKVSAIAELESEGHSVCMVGDGVNDAPALKTASVGVAMGDMGSDIAVDAADIVLIGDDLSKLPYLKRLANATVNTIRFSITLSMCINFVAVTMSCLSLLTPTTGALVHNCGSCLVVLIAALLYDRKI